jgi:excisionase family DNA binding protein
MTNKTFLDTIEAAQYLGLQKTTLEAWRSRGEGPRFVKLGRAVRYRQSDLEAWIESRVRTNTLGGEAA